MLPTLEFLRNEPCPFFRAGLCDRPHCPFRHSSSDRDSILRTVKEMRISSAKSKMESKLKIPIPCLKGKDTDLKEKDADQKDKDADQKGKNADKKGKDADKKGKDADKKGKDADKKGKDADKKGKDSDKKGKEADKKGKDVDKKGKDMDKKGKDVVQKGKNMNQKGKNLEQKVVKESEDGTTKVEDEEKEERKRLEEEYERMILGEDESDDDLEIDPEIVEQFLMPDDTDEDPGELMDACYKEWLRSKESTEKEAKANKKEIEKEPLIMKQIETSEASPAKKRIAHTNSESSRSSKVTTPPNKSKIRLTPSQTLQNRYEYAEKATSHQHQSQQINDDQETMHLWKKRISHDPKHGLMTMSFKQRIERIETSSTTTVAQSSEKGSTRKAHSPIQVLPRSPVISKDTLAMSKIPLYSRQQTLNQLYKACENIYAYSAEASERAIKEELTLATRHKNKQVYIGAAANCLKRLRDEVATIDLAKAQASTKIDFKDAAISSANPTSSTANIRATAATSTNFSKGGLPTQSHQSVLAGRTKYSWSIETKKLAEFPVKEKLYQAMKVYLLTPQQLSDNGYPMSHPSGDRGRITTENRLNKSNYTRDSTQRVCDRCNQSFVVGLDGFPVKKSQCMYHSGRSNRRRGLFEERYSCCDGETSSPGCAVANVHVSVHPSQEIYGFVAAIKELGDETTMGNDSWDIVAIDCEMIYTTYGCELARATFVSSDKKILYDEVVKPIHPIIDYNTRFSGITAEMMEKVTTTLTDVQAVMLTRFRPNTILIGHSLESDLLALKLKHDCVIDTAIIMPHRRGLPFKRALRSIASDCLGKIIQNGETGHDSHEDAVSALEVVLWKINGDNQKNQSESKRIKYC